ncbi:MAG: hypothetical protein QG608_164 [Actinomycetota bacterium]|nr:hypothetical protein [Actinomycetota bacterium]
MTEEFRTTVERLFKARYPLLYVESFEEQRVIAEVRTVALDATRMRTPRGVAIWSTTQGLIMPDGTRSRDTADPTKALEAALSVTEPTVFVFLDLHPFLGYDGRSPDPRVVRLLRDAAAAFKSGPVPKILILLSPVRAVPADLEKEITLVDFPFPEPCEIASLLDSLITANAGTGRIHVRLDAEERQRMVAATSGLTLGEAENAFARAMADGSLTGQDIDRVLEEKRQIIRKSGMLDFIPCQVSRDDVGGLENLKSWLSRREGTWLPHAAEYGLPFPRGVLVTGVPGCGKSLTARATASAWGLPLLRLDMGRVFAGIVGSSEQNMRSAIRTAEAISPCVLWIDEIEKGFGGAESSISDSGTSSRVFGTFLTWMQEKTRPVFVIATANNLNSLPGEFLRKGRFDEIFFVDLPTKSERRAIWHLHLARRLQYPAAAREIVVNDDLIRRLADATDGYSGAEIEQIVAAALVDAFSERRGLRDQDLFRSARNMVPLSLVQADRIKAVREWAGLRAVAATATEDLDGAEFLMDPTGGFGVPNPGARGRDGFGSDDDPPSGSSRGGRIVDY